MRRRLPAGVLAAGLLVALATLGMVNGLWSKNLVVNGIVATGDLNADWTTASSSDDFGPDDCTAFGNPNPNTPDPNDTICPVPKDVGSLSCFVDRDDRQILHFRIFNGYPSYEADCEVHLTNTGSIPFIVRGFAIDTSHSTPPLTGCTTIASSPQSMVILCDQLKIGWVDNVGLQVDPGHQVASSVIVHVEQAAAQNTCTGSTSYVDLLPPGPSPNDLIIVTPTCSSTAVAYDFQIKVCAAQWNEAATYEQCVLSPQHEGPEFPP